MRGRVFASRVGLIGARALACAVGLALSAPAAAFPPGVRAVRQGAPPGGDGMSWATAFDMQPALAAAAVDPSVTEIWVAEGTYYPGPVGAPPGSVFEFHDLALYGGFAGTEAIRGQRRPDVRVTTLTNDLDRSGAASNDDAYCTLRMSGGLGTRLDGFRVVARRAYQSGGPNPQCGLWFSGSGMIANCGVIGTTASAGIGALQMDAHPGARIVACSIEGHGHWQAGVVITGDLLVLDSTIAGYSSHGGPGLAIGRARVVRSALTGVSDSSNPVRVDNLLAIDSTISGHSEYAGGAAVSLGEAALVRGSVQGYAEWTAIEATTITGRDCDLWGTSRQTRGVAVTNVHLVNTRIFASGPQRALVLGGGELSQCTVSTANGPRSIQAGNSVTMTGSVLWSSGGPASACILDLPPGTVGTVNYCCVYGWDSTLGGLGNISEDPIISTFGRLYSGSPCIDAGPGIPPANLPYDADGNCRITDGNSDGVFRIDIGAYEFRQCPANFDCSTGAPLLNASDLLYFLDRFRAGDTRTNCDGSTIPPVLNVLDFNCYLSRFVAGCP